MQKPELPVQNPAEARLKQLFDIARALQDIAVTLEPFPPAALFQLADEGFDSLFEVLTACIISIRTFDEMTLPCARRLFQLARTPTEMSRLAPAGIDKAIAPSTFHEAKAHQIHAIAQDIMQQHAGVLPCTLDTLLAFRGVGPKCANLALGIACGQAHIGVDIHVHRITNRWGYVAANTPERTLAALEAKLPPAYWVDINRLLVPFGKHVCTGTLPRCLTCPVLDMCRQVGVTTHR